MSVSATLSTALSGLTATDTMMTVSASNLANMYTPGHKAARPNLAPQPTGGVAVASITTDPTPGPLDDTGLELSNTDPATEIVHGILAKHLYTPSAQMIRAADDMMGTLLDVTSTK
jgi:flagellar hook protein FlgE